MTCCELSPRERVDIMTRSLVNLRAGAGQYTPRQREEEIAEAGEALRDAFLDYSADRKQPVAVHG